MIAAGGNTVLKLVVFLGGAVLMALEIVGSRILAPRLGSSIFVWGSLISVFLTALSVGYYWGGALADRRPRLSVLGALLVVPGLWTWLLPFFAPPVNEWVASLSLGPRWSPLVASFLLFAVPSIFLGTLSPYAIRLEVQSVESVGNTSGRLYALSTAGSIAGTLVATFFLIPAMGVRNIVHSLGLLLLVLAASTLLAPRLGSKSGRRGRALLPFLAIAMLAGVTPWGWAAPEAIYQRDTLYHHVIVRDAGSIRYLHFDNSYQSAMNLENPDEQVFPYTRYLHLSRLFAPEARRILFVGLGGGSAPSRFLRDYPESVIDVAEIDPEVIRVAQTYFQLPESERLRVHAADGRRFVQESQATYDLVVLDAYFSESIPFHLTTKEFLEEVRARLAPEGVVAANLIGAVAGPHSRLFRAMLRTYQEVFEQVYVFPVGGLLGANDPVVRNIILVAARSEERLSRSELQARAEALRRSGAMRMDVWPYAGSLIEQPIETGDVPVLTDDYAPVDSLQHF